MRNRKLFGAVAQRVEPYRFTILVATIWKGRLKAERRTENEQEPNARRDYICNMSRLGKTLVGSFENRLEPDGKCWRDYMAERSRKREAQVRFQVVSQEAIAQKNVSRILLPSLKTVANARGTTS